MLAQIMSLLVSVILLASSPVFAETIAWNNNTGGSWDTPSNWMPTKVPAPGDDVVIDSATSSTISNMSETTIRTLALRGASKLALVSGTLKLSPILPQYSLTIHKTGDGNGTVTSSPVALNCGTTCSALFDLGSVTLSANAATGSVFTGWSGGNCLGTGSCFTSINAATDITATFMKIVVPAASFTQSPSATLVRNAIQFTDTSTGFPTTWSWNFGDGTISSAQNPSHTYTTTGIFPVSLTASNSSGQSVASANVVVAPGTWSDYGPPLTFGISNFSFCEINISNGFMYVCSVDGIYKLPLDHSWTDSVDNYLWSEWPTGIRPTRLSINALGNPVVNAANLSNSTLSQLGKIIVWNGTKFVTSTVTPAPTSGNWWYGIAGGMPLDPVTGNMYLAGNLKVMKSIDNGLSFDQISDLGSIAAGTGSSGLSGYIYTLRAMPWGELFIGGETKGFYHSTDGGITWSAIPRHDKMGNRYDVMWTKDGEVLMSDCADTNGNFMWRYTSDGQYVPAMNGLSPWLFNDQTTFAFNPVYADSGENYAAVKYAKGDSLHHIIKWDGTAWMEIENFANGPVASLIHSNSMGSDGSNIYTQATTGQVKKWTPAVKLPFKVNLGVIPISRPLSGGTVTGTVTVPGNYTYAWTARSEAGTVAFGSPDALTTSVDFSANGDYVLNLKVSNGTVTTGDSIIVHVP